jgi:hypothetical protein
MHAQAGRDPVAYQRIIFDKQDMHFLHFQFNCDRFFRLDVNGLLTLVMQSRRAPQTSRVPFAGLGYIIGAASSLRT